MSHSLHEIVLKDDVETNCSPDQLLVQASLVLQRDGLLLEQFPVSSRIGVRSKLSRLIRQLENHHRRRSAAWALLLLAMPFRLNRAVRRERRQRELVREPGQPQ